MCWDNLTFRGSVLTNYSLIFHKCICNYIFIKWKHLKAISDFAFAYKKKPILFNIWKMPLESFSYQIWKFESYFGLFICLQKEKKFKIKKSSRRDNFNSSAFFTPNPIQYLKNAFGIIFISNVKIWKLFWTFHLLTKPKKNQNSKNVAPGQFQFFCFFSHPILSNIWEMHLESFSY